MDKEGQELRKSDQYTRSDVWSAGHFLELCEYMHSASSVEQLTGWLVSRVAGLFNVNKVSFMLLDENKQELALNAFQGLDPSVAHATVKLGESFSGKVAKEGKALLVRDVENEYPDSPRSRLSRYQSNSFVIVPVKTREKILGVISLTDKKDAGYFNNEDLKVLELLSNNVAVHIENIRLSEKNKTLAIIDPLTELFNHRYFQEQLLEEIYRAERYRRSMSIMMLDIDNFSAYNQAHGYSAGDAVLKQIGSLIKENIRQVDVLCRYGLDEFAIILPETKMKETLFVGEKVRERISTAVFTEKENRKSSLGMTRLTVSVGIAEHRLGLSKEEFIRHASAALLEAQQKGRNCVCVFK